MTRHQALVEGKTTLLKQGWAQFNGSMHAMYIPGDPTCINLAVFKRHTDKDRNEICGSALELVAANLGLGSLGDLARWNDQPGRTFEEVVDALDKAIAATAPEPDVSFLDSIEETETQEVEYAEAIG